MNAERDYPLLTDGELANLRDYACEAVSLGEAPMWWTAHRAALELAECRALITRLLDQIEECTCAHDNCVYGDHMAADVAAVMVRWRPRRQRAGANCDGLSASSSLHDWERRSNTLIGGTWLVNVRCRACGVTAARPGEDET